MPDGAAPGFRPEKPLDLIERDYSGRRRCVAETNFVGWCTILGDSIYLFIVKSGLIVHSSTLLTKSSPRC
jgi:hypothetical protein